MYNRLFQNDVSSSNNNNLLYKHEEKHADLAMKFQQLWHLINVKVVPIIT